MGSLTQHVQRRVLGPAHPLRAFDQGGGDTSGRKLPRRLHVIVLRRLIIGEHRCAASAYEALPELHKWLRR
eukprot:1719050-Pyramimonas_sp.AAC.1